MHHESEFGVPFPGRVLPREEWTRTALKELPAGLIDWEALFGRAAPVVIDLGCGNGRFTIADALARPELNHFGLDVLPLVIRYARKRANQRGLRHTLFAVIGAQEFLAQHVAAGSVAELHLYHPQPCHDPREAAERLVTPEFLALVHRSLADAGLFVFQTDDTGYWNYARETLPRLFTFHEHPSPWSDAPQGRTRREIYALQHRLRVFRAVCRRLPLAEEERAAIVAELPPPAFRTRRRRSSR